MIFTISTKPIIIPSLLRPSLKQANWGNFENEIHRKYINPELPEENPILEDIDTYIDDWFNTITDAVPNNIPLEHTLQSHIHNSATKHKCSRRNMML